MTEQDLDRAIQPGQTVETADGAQVGTVSEVWTDVGTGEAWGAVGSMPQNGSQATDQQLYAYSEAMPGEGSNYFRVTTTDGQDLYVPFASVSEVRGGVLHLAVDADTVESLQWDIKPDFVNVASEPDSQGGSSVA